MMIAPDLEMIREHLAWLSKDLAADDYRIEIAWGPPDAGPRNGRTYLVRDASAAADEALRANLELNNVYLGVTLKRPDTPGHGRTNSDHAALATCMAFDFDRDLAESARSLGSIAHPQLLVLTGTHPEARGQAWVRIDPLFDIDLWDGFAREIAEFCAADMNAVGVSRLMRLAGTVSYPSSSKRARGYRVERTELLRGSRKAYCAMDIWWDLPRSQAAPGGSLKILPHKADQLPLNVTNVAIIHSALAALPLRFSDEYELWRNVGFALHDYDHGPVGLALWKAFSDRCESKAIITNFEAYWSRFGRLTSSAKITLGTLIHHAKESGWRASAPWDRVTRIT